MVDLEDAELRPGVSVGEGVEAGAKQDVLGDTACDGLSEQVFRVTAAGDDEGAQARQRTAAAYAPGSRPGVRSTPSDVGAEDGDGDRIVEDERRAS